MKPSIHPAYSEKTKVLCACGNSFEVGSTATELHVELCYQCHPFYTGKQKLVDTAGRVDRFTARTAKKEAASTARKGKKVKKVAQTEKKKVKAAAKAKAKK